MRPDGMRRVLRLALAGAGLLVAVGGAGYCVYTRLWRTPQEAALVRFITEPGARAGLVSHFEAPCPGAPFLVPSGGLVGGLPWRATAAPYNVLRPHPGIDIFGDGAPGTVPVRAAYDGWLTREHGWIASVIIRHDDPLHPGETIWTYYTHMANYDGSTSYIAPDFPPGTEDKRVWQGEVLGYQGVYNGGPGHYLVAMHVHFSIVRSSPDGAYRNEAIFANTLDPSPYFGLPLAAGAVQFPARCP